MFMFLSFDSLHVRRLCTFFFCLVTDQKTSLIDAGEVGDISCRHFVVSVHMQTGRYAEPSLPSVPFVVLDSTESRSTVLA
jgi:hypothetical protein